MPWPSDNHDADNITAGLHYRSGAKHYAWDIAMPIGTPLRAITRGKILALNDGVTNNRSGHNPGPGSPSNWIVLGFYYKGRKAYALYQHLSPGIKVKVGDSVRSGQIIGKSGNTGNSSGPHLHIATGWGWPGEYGRYNYLRGGDALIYPPSQVFTPSDPLPTPFPLSSKHVFGRGDSVRFHDGDTAEDARHIRRIQRNVGFTGILVTGKYNAWTAYRVKRKQRRLGLAETGNVGAASWKAFGL